MTKTKKYCDVYIFHCDKLMEQRRMHNKMCSVSKEVENAHGLNFKTKTESFRERTWIVLYAGKISEAMEPGPAYLAATSIMRNA